MDSLSRQWIEQLAERGYRITAPRQVIVEIMARSQKALDAIEVYDQGRTQYPGLGLVTVYRTLEKLEQTGFIQRVHQLSGCHRYLRSPQGHQHFLICDVCGQVEYFSGDDLSTLFDSVARRTGYEVRNHWLQLFGLCANCKQT